MSNETKSFAELSGQYFKNVWAAILTVLKGLPVTLGYLLHPKRIVTEQYPENKDTLKMHERFRGQVIMPHDENGDHKCTGCTLCEKACPNGSISVLNTKNVASKKVLGKYIYRFDQCTLCSLCIESCPFGAIEMGPGFENSVCDKAQLDLVLNEKEGRA